MRGSRPGGASGARGSGGHDGQRRGRERPRGAPGPAAAPNLGLRPSVLPPSTAAPRGWPGQGGGAGPTWAAPISASG